MIDKELVVQARRANLVAYLFAKGEELVKAGKSYRHKVHDSLYVKDNMFTWYSRHAQGNSIDFLMLYYNMSFEQAVSELTNTQFSLFALQSQSEHFEFENVNYNSNNELQIERAENDKRVIAYLCKKRMIKNTIVFSLIKRKLLFQDTHGNCCFVMRSFNTDANINAAAAAAANINAAHGTSDTQFKQCTAAAANINAAAAELEIHGTSDTRFKQCTAHSSNSAFYLSFNEITDVLYFESAIDLLSCYQIYQSKFNHHLLVSLAGLNSSIVRTLYKQNSNLRHFLCVDNDEAGTKFIETMKQELDLHIFRPPENLKDWNEYLKQLIYPGRTGTST